MNLEPIAKATLERDSQFIRGIYGGLLKLSVSTLRDQFTRKVLLETMEMAVRDQLHAMAIRKSILSIPRFQIRLRGDVAMICFNLTDIARVKSELEVRASKLDFRDVDLTGGNKNGGL